MNDNDQRPPRDLIGRLLREERRSGGIATEADALPGARRLGLRMAALYRYWQRTGGPDLPRLADELLRHIGVPAATPLGCTCREVAEAVSRWQGSAYHSARHHAEVATNAVVLATISARSGAVPPAHDLGLLLAAALAHDIHFDPTQDPGERFAAEERSAQAIDAIAARCGVDGADRRAIRLLVLATEPKSRADFTRIIDQRDGQVVLPDLLAPLAREPSLLALVALLSDADLLSSAGLTRAWAKVQGRRLAREKRMPLGKADWQRFLNDVVGPHFLSPGGRYFAGNLARIRNPRAAPGLP